MIIIDNVWPRSALRRPLAWATRRLDRGQWVRSEADLKAIVASASPSIGRMTYTLTGLELLLTQGQVEAQKEST